MTRRRCPPRVESRACALVARIAFGVSVRFRRPSGRASKKGNCERMCLVRGSGHVPALSQSGGRYRTVLGCMWTICLGHSPHDTVRVSVIRISIVSCAPGWCSWFWYLVAHVRAVKTVTNSSLLRMCWQCCQPRISSIMGSHCSSPRVSVDASAPSPPRPTFHKHQHRQNAPYDKPKSGSGRSSRTMIDVEQNCVRLFISRIVESPRGPDL